jgi:GNAT superfamily N-acetyltransferase
MPTYDITTRKVRCMDILNAPNADVLFAAYAEDCLMLGAKPQVEIYQAMEAAGVLTCLGTYEGGKLVGFATVVANVMPHNGKRIATIESLFVERFYREFGVAAGMLRMAATLAEWDGCKALLYTARVGSELETMLTASDKCERTHSVFTEWL